jgi:hypothetical protein
MVLVTGWHTHPLSGANRTRQFTWSWSLAGTPTPLSGANRTRHGVQKDRIAAQASFFLSCLLSPPHPLSGANRTRHGASRAEQSKSRKRARAFSFFLWSKPFALRAAWTNCSVAGWLAGRIVFMYLSYLTRYFYIERESFCVVCWRLEGRVVFNCLFFYYYFFGFIVFGLFVGGNGNRVFAWIMR